MQDFNLIDIWRNRHPDNLTYSYYSSTHKTFSCINYFLLSTDLISNVKKVSYWHGTLNKTERAINSIQIKKSEITFDQTKINEVFRNYYRALYSSEYSESAAVREKALQDALDFEHMFEFHGVS